MIEIVYEKEKQKPDGNEGYFRIPNNIRQIGEISGTQKIYIEDYAYTYLCRIATENSHRGMAAILMGQSNWKDGNSYLFVKSAVALEEMEVSEEHLAFTQEIWNHVYEKNKEYFPEQEVVGWFLSIPGCSMELHEVICQTHLNHFGGNDKILLVREPLEKEEAFYRYEDGKMSRQTGFYVYYEKNEPMRSFLISQNAKQEKKTEDVDDSAVHTFRKKVEMKNETEEKQRFPVFKTVGVCAMAAALAVGVLYVNDYKKAKSNKTAVASIKEEAEEPVKVTPVNGSLDENTKTEEKEEVKEEITEEDFSGEAASKEETKSSQPTNTPAQTSYIIQQGDTLTKISIKNYGNAKRVKEICELNQIQENDLIYPGQTILLP
ncbi:MAG: LysM peptidoglycan-binding domain-containing protein [Bacillota bacterium]|nr:LysM peptidoglycan-binding domain-containing protein [Bacillota bacterium]